MTDEELLLEYRMTGGSDVFETLVKRYERELYNYLRRFLNNQVLAEDALEAEAEPLGRPPAAAVERVAFPLEAAVALAEQPVGEEIDHLAGRAGPLQRRREADMSDLDRAGIQEDADG